MRFLVLILTVLFVTATAHGQRRTKEKVVNLQNFDKKKTSIWLLYRVEFL